MKTINIDGKEYVSKEDYDKKGKASTININPTLIDDKDVIAIGEATINGEWHKAEFNIDYLKRAITVLEQIGEKNPTILFKSDHPILIGSYDKTKQTVKGIFIAPMKETDL